MYVQMNCAIVDADSTNRQELAGFLERFGIHIVAQLPTADSLTNMLGRPEGPQLVIINLDPNAGDTLKRVGHFPRQFPGPASS
jgi:hypothetical protein